MKINSQFLITARILFQSSTKFSLYAWLFPPHGLAKSPQNFIMVLDDLFLQDLSLF